MAKPSDILSRIFSLGGLLYVSDKAAYFLFFCLAFNIWLVNRLSENTYFIDIPLNTDLINIPDTLILSRTFPEQLEVRVKGSGYDLLRSYFKLRGKTLVWDYAQFKSRAAFPAQELLASQADYLENLEVIAISPPEIELSAERKISKILPIDFRYQVQFRGQYRMRYDRPSFTPTSVKVSGTKVLLDTLQSIATDTVMLADVRSTQTGQVSLIKPLAGNLQLQQELVNYEIVVEEYTEKKLDIPISVKNYKQKGELALFPATALLSCLVPLSEYNKTTAALFKVEADFSNIQPQDSVLHFNVTEYPAFARQVNIYPSKSQFFILNP